MFIIIIIIIIIIEARQALKKNLSTQITENINITRK